MTWIILPWFKVTKFICSIHSYLVSQSKFRHLGNLEFQLKWLTYSCSVCYVDTQGTKPRTADFSLNCLKRSASKLPKFCPLFLRNVMALPGHVDKEYSVEGCKQVKSGCIIYNKKGLESIPSIHLAQLFSPRFTLIKRSWGRYHPFKYKINDLATRTWIRSDVPELWVMPGRGNCSIACLAKSLK